MNTSQEGISNQMQFRNFEVFDIAIEPISSDHIFKANEYF